MWKRILRNAPGLLTLVFAEDEIQFASAEFVSHFQKVLGGDAITLDEVQQKFETLKATNSCIAGSLWEKIREYKNNGENVDAEEPKALGEFVLLPGKDEESAFHYAASIEVIQWKGESATLLHLIDITASKKAQREVLCKKYKNILLTTASHELRTPLNGVLGGVQLIEECGDIVSIREYCKMMHCSCKLLVNITDDILDYCLYEGGNLILNVEEVRLREVFAEAVTIVEVQTKQRGVELRVKFDTNVPECVKTDRKRLLQILLNILGNASKYTFEGAITVTVEGREQDVKVKIADTGIGINETKKESLFKLFGRISSEANQEGSSGGSCSNNTGSKVTAGAGSGLGLHHLRFHRGRWLRVHFRNQQGAEEATEQQRFREVDPHEETAVR